MRAPARLVLILLLSLGVVLPKATVALAQLAHPGARTVVICTGTSLQALVLDAEGNPVETAEDPHRCLLVHAVDTAVPVHAVARGLAPRPVLASPQGAAAPVPALPRHVAQPRAPPAA